MPKHKPKRGNPSIDMTAMCDVAFLLLTFFMLTAKTKPQEAVPVDTPTSISETKLPDAGTLTILISPEGKTYLDMAGQHTRKDLINVMNGTYQMGLNEEEKIKFANAGGFGIPMNRMKQWLNTPPAERGKFPADGVPIDTADINKSELATWIHQSRLAQFRMKQQGVVPEEYVIIVKADSQTPYPSIQRVINTLVDINVNKFNLITSMEADPNKVVGAKAEKH